MAAGWREMIERSGLFTPFEQREARFVDELDSDGLVDRIGSVSFVAVAPPAKRAELTRGLRELAAAHGGAVRFAYRTQAFVTFSVG